ncbi:MAG: DNA/RNA non-specific endonuclease [Rikenellaceae bacterium]
MIQIKGYISTLLLLLTILGGYAQASKYLPTANGEVVEHSYYTLSYIEQYEQAEWVYYELTLPMVSGSQSRTDDFREDKMVSTISAQLDDYKGSGYDRGHLCPAGSMTHNLMAMSESFYLSNMSPQVPSFNRGRWKQLEERVRSWVVSDSLLYVISGPVLTDNMPVIGNNRVAVPLHYYKVIYSPTKSQMIAFLMPNENIKEPVSNYTVTVDQIEEITGIDFFHDLPETLEHHLETSIDTSKWNFSSAPKIEKSSATTTNTSSSPTTCLGVTKSGTPCKNSTKNANGYCHLHQSQVP